MGRPKKHKIDVVKVEQLASFGCTNTEIASFFDVNESIIRRSYAEYLTKGRDKGKIRLRQMQWKSAEKGNVVMLIWLGKQVLGQSDTPEIMEDELVKGFDLEII
tara:strand:- start:320 stop:631 length:312 start_codon:yes stop_codon:yes gene_type:complete